MARQVKSMLALALALMTILMVAMATLKPMEWCRGRTPSYVYDSAPACPTRSTCTS